MITTLRSVPEARAGDFNVQFRAPNAQVIRCRLVAIRKSEPATESARQKILADGRRVSGQRAASSGKFQWLAVPEVSLHQPTRRTLVAARSSGAATP